MTAQGLVAEREGLVVGLAERATGLVPSFAAYPSSTFVGTERIVVVVVLKKRLGLSMDKDASGDEDRCGDPKRWEEDVGSDRCQSKMWVRAVGRCCRRCQTSVAGEGDGTIGEASSGDGQRWGMSREPRWRCLTVVVVDEGHRLTRVEGDREWVVVEVVVDGGG